MRRKRLLLAFVLALVAAAVVPFFVVHCKSAVENRCGSTASRFAYYLWEQIANQIMPSLIFRTFILAFLVSFALIWLIGRLRNGAIDA